MVNLSISRLLSRDRILYHRIDRNACRMSGCWPSQNALCQDAGWRRKAVLMAACGPPGLIYYPSTVSKVIIESEINTVKGGVVGIIMVQHASQM